MAVFRAVLLLMLVAGAGCFGAYALTGQARFRAWGLTLVRWTVLAGLGFFAVLIFLRLTEAG